MKTKLVFLFVFLLNSKLFACEFDKPTALNIYTSLNNQSSHAYDATKTLHDMPIIRAFNCKKLALRNQYVMIGLGPELNEFSDHVRTYSFNDSIKPSSCKVENSPIKILSFEEKLKGFKKHKEYYNKCVEIYIDDEGIQPLKISEEQPGCKVRRLTNHKAVIEGGYCFIKPNVGSSFLFKLRIKKECQTRAGLEALNLNPTDIKGIFNFYAAGDDSGNSRSLRALDSVSLRLLTNSDEKIIPSSESYGDLYPQFPTLWVNPNTHLAQVVMEDMGANKFKIRAPLLVDNRCKKLCKNGLCYSSCNYAQPVVYEARLYEVGRKKDHILTSWYDGGVAGANYQGFIHGVGFEIPSTYFDSSKTYRIELNFNDPKFDFERFKNRIIRKFGEIQQKIPQLGRSGIAPIPTINEINKLSELPEIRQIFGINFESGIESLKSAVELLRSYLSYKTWPPYYDKNCSTDLKKCASAGSDDTKINFYFKYEHYYDEEEDEDLIRVIPLKVKRSSKLLQNYTGTKLPYLKCN